MANIIDALITQHGPKIVDAALRSKEGRSHLAQLIAGTSDKSTRQYKSARRTVERHSTPKGGKQTRGQGPKAKPFNPRLSEEGRRELAAQVAERTPSAFPKQIKATVYAQWKISDDARPWRPVRLALNSSADVAEYIRRAAEGDEEGAIKYMVEKDGNIHTSQVSMEDMEIDVEYL